MRWIVDHLLFSVSGECILASVLQIKHISADHDILHSFKVCDVFILLEPRSEEIQSLFIGFNSLRTQHFTAAVFDVDTDHLFYIHKLFSLQTDKQVLRRPDF